MPSQSVTIDAIALNTPLDASLFAPKRRVTGDSARGLDARVVRSTAS